jgi:scyllo-inositol 2-dehydrogenase (NADP+)
MNKIRISCIGSGWVVSNRHIPSLSKNSKYEIVAIVGRQEAKLKKLAETYKIPKYYTGDATKNTEWLKNCDAVMIGVDPFHHYELAKFCLTNGKHVLMEKPFTTSIEKSKELVELAEKMKLKFAIVHNMQYSRAIVNLDKDIQHGRIGPIKGIHAMQFGNPQRRLPSWYDKLPWGLYFDESPHLLYLLDKYGEGLTLINAVKFNSTTNLNTPALVTANFMTNIGVPASLYLNFEATVSEWNFIIFGEKRLGVVDLFRDIYFSLPNDQGHKALDILNTSRHAIFGHLKGTFSSGLKVINKNYFSGFETVIDIFSEAILNNKSLSAISAKEALKTNRLQFQLISKATAIKNNEQSK